MFSTRYNNGKILNIYNADDEEPKCLRCDNYDAWDCENSCGWENGWAGYLRREIVDDY